MLHKSIVRILDITRLCPKNSGSIYAYHLDRPKRGDYYDTHHLPFGGWVLSQKSPIVSLEFIVEGELLHKTQLNHPRPDVLTAHPDVSVSPENVGFSTALAMETYSLATLAFPVAIAVACFLLIIILLVRRSQLSNPKNLEV